MHGSHPFEGPMQLWWSQHANGSHGAHRESHPHNLFRPIKSDGRLDTSQMSKAGGLVDDSGGIRSREKLHAAMAELATLLKRLAEPQPATPSDPGVPAGYTYLLQFISHDMVDSIVELEIARGGLMPTRRNSRERPLMLDVLYGGGPDEVPYAYALDELPVEDSGFVPRIRLRVGPRLERPAITAPGCPFRDIARATTRPELSDDAFPTIPEMKDRELRSDVLVADPRNDSHALVSQLTVLFALLHNEIVDCLKGVPHESGPGGQNAATAERAKRERAHRTFLCARLAVTEIYRRIIFDDVLPRFLDRRVLQRYQGSHGALLGNGDSIPLEFTFGAFRFGHALVQPDYKVNSETPIPTEGALRLGSARAPWAPLNDPWLVDWRRFFFDDTSGNFSRRLAPSYAAPLNLGSEFAAPVVGLDTAGLMDRDLLSSCYAGLLSLEALIGKLAGVFRDDTLRPFAAEGDHAGQPQTAYAAWRERLFRWLCDQVAPEALDDQLRRRFQAIAADPPLPFFVLFEAQFGQALGADGKPMRIGGRRLGPIGSIIVAEAFYGANAAYPLTRDATLPEALGARLGAYARAYFPAAGTEAERRLAALAVAEVTSMTRLIDFLERRGHLGSAA